MALATTTASARMGVPTASATLAVATTPSKSQAEILLMVAVDRAGEYASPAGAKLQSKQSDYESFSPFPGENVQDLKLRLQAKRGYYTHGQMVIFGDRDQQEHEQLAPLAQPMTSEEDYLHLFVRLADIEGVDVVTNKRSISWGPGSGIPNAQLPLLPAAYLPRTESAQSYDFQSSQSSVFEELLSDGEELFVPEEPLSLVGLEMETSSSFGNFVHVMVRRGASRKLQYVVQGDVFELAISASDSVGDVTRKIVEAQGNDSRQPHALVYEGRQLEASAPLASHDIQSGARLQLTPLALPSMPAPGSPPGLSSTDHALFREWQEAKEGLEEGHRPKLAAAGSGGSYFLAGKDGSTAAVFKPEDEEPRAVNNPRGFGQEASGEGLRKGVLPGEGATREVAAFVLDHHRFAGVPPTAMVSFQEEDGRELKRGSLQQFITYDYDCEEISPSVFSVEQCQRIFTLDLRLANCDRNASNILATRTSDGWALTPIDHGYSLPATLQDVSFEWMYWPQASAPWTQECLDYIAALDADSDIALLEAHGLTLRPECLRILRSCTMLLKKGAAAGMTPYEIGRLVAREFLTMSPLEKLHRRAMRVASGGHARPVNGAVAGRRLVDEDIYLVEMDSGLDELIDELMLDGVHPF